MISPVGVSKRHQGLMFCAALEGPPRAIVGVGA